MRLPVGVEPVNEILSTSGCAIRASPVGSPGPWTMLTTPGGRPGRSSSRRNSASVDAGVSSEVLTTIVQPAAIAAPILRTARSTGSFHGMISAQTPIGWVSVMSSTLAGEAPVTVPSSRRPAPAK